MKNESGKLSMAMIFFVMLIVIIIVLLLSMVKLMVDNRNQKQEITTLNDTIQVMETQLKDAENKLETVANIVGNNENQNSVNNEISSNTYSEESLNQVNE